MQLRKTHTLSLILGAAALCSLCGAYANVAQNNHQVQVVIDASTIGKVNAKLNGKALSTTPQKFSFNAANQVVSAAVYGKNPGNPAMMNVSFSLVGAQNQASGNNYTLFFTANYLTCGAYVNQKGNCTPCQANGWNPPYYTICTVKG